MGAPHVEQASAKIAAAGSYISAGATTVFGLTLNEWGVIVGMGCTVLTYVTYLFFKVRDDRRKTEAVLNGRYHPDTDE